MKQLKTLFFVTLTFIACGLMSCNQSGETPATTGSETAADSLNKATPPPVEKKAITMVVSHKVKDYAKWRPFFDKDAANREPAHMTLLGVYQDAKDPNNVSISMLVEDTAAAKKFAASEELKKAMTAAGVEGAPEVKFYELQVNNEASGNELEHRLFIVMKVADYETFKAAFHGNDSLRTARGITPLIVARNLDDTSEVALSLAAKDQETLKKHYESPEVKAAIQKAGSTGEPMVQYATKAKGTPM